MTRARRIVLTGASGGIGQALAGELASPGVSMLLIGRNATRLTATAEAARSRGVQAETALIDVRDTEAMARQLTEFDAATPVDLVIANAGISIGLLPGQEPEDRTASRRVLEINYGGALNTIEPLLPTMIRRGSGHIVLMSSLAALRPLPDMPSYSASKAAIRAYGISLRGWLEPRGVRVTVVSPGFVTSRMSKRHHGFKAFEVSAEHAARIIRRGLERNRALITFPWQLAFGIWLGDWLPPRISDIFARRFPAEIEPED